MSAISTGAPPRRRERVGVVVPAHDAGAWISDALDSVAAQTRPPDECIIVDDGSADETADIVVAWIGRVTFPVHLIRQDNRGASLARSTGLMASTCDGVVLLDADDILHPLALATLVAGALACPEAVACFGDAERVTFDGTTGTPYLQGKPILSLPCEERRTGDAGPAAPTFRLVGDGLFESLLDGSYIANCASWVDRQAAIAAGLWNRAFRTAEDRDFWLRLSRLGPFAYTPERLATVRYHDRNLTAARGRADHAANGARVLERLLEDADGLGLSPEEGTAVRAALGRAREGALYMASREGIASYIRTARALGPPPGPLGILSPRHVGRALLAVRRDPHARSTPRG